MRGKRKKRKKEGKDKGRKTKTENCKLYKLQFIKGIQWKNELDRPSPLIET